MKKKIGYLGCGAWGICLANLLAGNGHDVQVWSIDAELIKKIQNTHQHPAFPTLNLEKTLKYTTHLEELLKDKEIIIESVTTSGLRPVAKQMMEICQEIPPLVITSKGIEKGTGMLLPEVALEIFGENNRAKIGCLTGPSLAKEVMQKMPASVVAAAFDHSFMHEIQQLFANQYFRVYPNTDVMGAAFGGAMKNIIAIACGISDGMGYGQNAKAALLTRGLHEIRKLAFVKNCRPETINGLAGLGDLVTTCLSELSRNYTFGNKLARGSDIEHAKKDIGMVVEGSFTCAAARELGLNHHIPLPITEAIYSIIYEHVNPKEAVRSLLTREVKEEHL